MTAPPIQPGPGGETGEQIIDDAAAAVVPHRHEVVPSEGSRLPVPLPPPPLPPRPRWRRLAIALLALIVAGGGGAFYWLKYSQPLLPSWIASGNGRLEADELDIATKFAGRIAQLFADEGDAVKADDVVARMDTRDLEASLKKSQAQVELAAHARDEARAIVTQQESQVLFARQELDRTQSLAQRGIATKELLDQRQQQLDAATAALRAANLRVLQSERALEAARHDVELYQINIADNTLRAPRDGRIQYRIANVGEVLPAGGKLFTMLDLSNVYMDIYLPAAETGKARIGDDARIVLDARPELAIPARVSFIAAKAQFTPKAVETRSEREKLMFRVRVRVNPEVLRAHADAVKSGLPGVAYVKLDREAGWPERLRGPRSG
ncbi:MAG TPA: HlyD family efflux transporter periplasmic adaptor subunit [Xanthobacteraceae bacterium]|jgi:HlyD family secretion protein